MYILLVFMHKRHEGIRIIYFIAILMTKTLTDGLIF